MLDEEYLAPRLRLSPIVTLSAGEDGVLDEEEYQRALEEMCDTNGLLFDDIKERPHLPLRPFF